MLALYVRIGIILTWLGITEEINTTPA